MDKQSRTYQAYVQILKEELIPAMGCTEPIAIAYAAAKARDVLGGMPDKVEIGVSSNIIKNVKSVIVPNTDGMKGIEAAAVAGIVGGQADKALEVISAVTADQKAAMRAFLKQVPVTVKAIDNGFIFDIIVTLRQGSDSAVVRITLHREKPFTPADEALFFRTVKAAFSLRRKTLSNALSNGFPELSKEVCTDLITAAGHRADIRGERLSGAEFSALSDLIAARLKKE